MSPEERKVSSELFLQQHSAPAYTGLPLIEEEAIRLRSADEVLRRTIALWAVAGTAFLKENDFFRDYIASSNRVTWLSHSDRRFLTTDARSDRDYIQFSWRLEALYFLAWCAGLIQEIELAKTESSVESIMDLFPTDLSEPSQLRAAIRIREKKEIVDWADRLYRPHWSFRDASLNGKEVPGSIVGGAVQEWHQAVNWMTCYEDEDNWDNVGTDS